jgi:hypothetical protein
MAMRKTHTSVAIRTQEQQVCELPLRLGADPPRPAPLPRRRHSSSGWKDALLRWLDEEM